MEREREQEERRCAVCESHLDKVCGCKKTCKDCMDVSKRLDVCQIVILFQVDY